MRPKIGLVLGGGGSRGLAHIGVLEVLTQENIPLDFIVATSMGSIVGSLFGLGYSPTEIGEGMRRIEQNAIIRSLSARARQRRIKGYLSDYLERKTFADLQLPVIMMAVDMINGQEVTLRSGPLLPAVLASSAVPGAFPPVRYQGTQLADGGVIDSLATHVAFDEGADKIIAVDVYPPLNTDNPWVDPVSTIMGVQLPSNLFSTVGNGDNEIPTAPVSLWRSVRVMTWYLHQQRLAAYPPDVLLQPDVGDYGSLDFKDVEGPRQAGFIEAERHLPAIRALLAD